MLDRWGMKLGYSIGSTAPGKLNQVQPASQSISEYLMNPGLDCVFFFKLRLLEKILDFIPENLNLELVSSSHSPTLVQTFSMS